MKTIIQKIGYDYDIEVVELEIPEDHIHNADEKTIRKYVQNQLVELDRK